jgi:hypothetical protein
MIIIPRHAAHDIEQLGSRDKYWFLAEDGITRTLFKIGRPNTGEHWAEVVVARIAGYFGIPHVRYDLAYDGRLGVATPSLVQNHRATRLIHGNELLARSFQAYPADQSKPGAAYNLRDIYQALSPYKGLREYDAPTEFGLYLFLDTLVANQDRHHENWGLLEMADTSRVLAPTFDHAASLACRLTNSERTRRLNTRDDGFSIDTFTRRAKSWFYPDRDGTRRLSTIEAFRLWVGYMKREAISGVYRQLEQIDESTWAVMFQDLNQDGITEMEQAFATRLLAVNRSRLIDVIQSVVQ